MKSNYISKINKHPLIKGTLLLTGAGIINRILGFVYRIFVSRYMGSEGMGLFQLVMPISAISICLCVSGIKTIISKLVAEYHAKNDMRTSHSLMTAILSYTLFLSIFISVIIYAAAPFISTKILGDLQCIKLIKILSFFIPLSCVHILFEAYFIGTSDAKICAVSGLVEQIAKMAFVFSLCKVWLVKGMVIKPEIMTAGLIAGETVSILYSVAMIKRIKRHHEKSVLKNMHTELKKLLTLSLPLTASRMLMSIFQSIEIVLIPIMLRANGYSNAEALSMLGVLTGMALPIILFPASLISSYATMLLPKISTYAADKNKEEMSYIINSTVRFCLILGVFCLFGFLLYGANIGAVLFSSPLVAPYIKTLAFLCPFMYISITFGSILNGLCLTRSYLIHSIISLSIRITGVIFFLKIYGIQSYLAALLLSELTLSLLHFIKIKSVTKVNIPLGSYIIETVFAALISFGCSYLVYDIVKKATGLNFVSLVTGGGIAGVIYFFLLTIRKECSDKHNN